MSAEGLKGNSTFSKFHPVVNLTYYVLAIGLTMFSMSPWFLGVTFVLAWVYSVLLKGAPVIRTNLILLFWIVLVMALINVIFVHDGETVLFYLRGNAVTAEALIYGISAAVMLGSVVIWFTSFNVIMTAEKLIYLFGRAAPVMGLTLSMIFRYIPLLRQRYREVAMGQQCLWAPEENGKKPPLLRRLRRAGKNVSILISWSLESSIESADSMEARGYGLRGRTSFHLYRFDRRDVIAEAWLIALGTICAVGWAMKKTEVWFYPSYQMHPFDWLTAVTLAAFAALLATPVVVDIAGERKWKRSDVTI